VLSRGIADGSREASEGAAPPSAIYLIGYRGAGKSTVGRLLALKLGREFRDLDQAIEESAGMTIARIFAGEGEAGFRERESRALAALAARPEGAVIATGGGVILSGANVSVLRASGTVVWLRASAAVLRDRMAKDSATASRRPALLGKSPLEEVEDVLAEREPLYRAAAHVEVDSGSLGAEEAVERIARALDDRDRGPLGP
jgi:shikimate kinase